ncbi:MAG: phosphotransferase [Nocardioidaceae bacterium]
MHDRTVLGAADVDDTQLAQLVATLLERPVEQVTLLDSCATEVPYDLPAITTAGRYWVRGHADVGDEVRPFSLFVKHVQSWSRSPFFAEVPADIAEMAEAGVPWRTEPLAYLSELRHRLPVGLRMPRAVGVFDLDEKSASIWLEEVVAQTTPWDTAHYARAAFLLGRLAGSPRVRDFAHVGRFSWTVHTYLEGRLRYQVLPMLREESIWRHPLVAGAFDDGLREHLLAAADRVDDLVDELAAMPLGTAHGDACPNNLLVTAEDDGFVLIDYGFWGEAPLGFDLGQLLVGDVQVGRRSADMLSELERSIVPAYIDGLRAEGHDVPTSVVRRAHALHLMVFTGLSTLPFELLGADRSPDLDRLAAERAEIARFSLRLLEATDSAR